MIWFVCFADNEATAQLSDEEVSARLQKFAAERQTKLVDKLVAKLAPFVQDDIARFKELIEGDLELKVIDWIDRLYCII
jgi:hypothetical protein